MALGAGAGINSEHVSLGLTLGLVRSNACPHMARSQPMLGSVVIKATISPTSGITSDAVSSALATNFATTAAASAALSLTVTGLRREGVVRAVDPSAFVSALAKINMDDVRKDLKLLFISSKAFWPNDYGSSRTLPS